ncbi:MAG: VacJ family lipoprotein [Casimicrobiaceae bacterium]|nr:VacJ family lipoprotein [Casimicrobiaceae bacterium]MCX8098431.1 VacJ family lipoprotein [Casimicrobiaceae bacterium]MDW8311143.1 VacJ family lipoprotein [Burkholderiales bacterium]
MSRLPLIAAAAGALLLAGCASFRAASPGDPLEPINRGLYSFNATFDHYLFRPIARAYDHVTPTPVKQGVANVFQNMADAQSAINSALQGKGKKAGDDLGRVLINTTFGLGGIFDHASALGLERGNEDFGQTLGHWGLGPGPYLVLPFLGPTTLRDLGGRLVDGPLDPLGYLSPVSARNALQGLRFVDARVQLFPFDQLLAQAALDKYTFTRSAYLQRRQSLVLDGRRVSE